MIITRIIPLLSLFASGVVAAQPIPTIRISVDHVTAHVSPTLYGLMTEEINFAYEGGLYGELIRNRSFKGEMGFAYSNDEPVYWSTVGDALIQLDHDQPLNKSLNLSLLIDARNASTTAPAGISNPGYWGIPVLPGTPYRVSFFAKSDAKTGPITVALGKAGGSMAASATINGITGRWQKFEVTLKTGAVAASKDNVFTLTTASPARIWLQHVSVFRPTFNDRPNGNRPDLMKLMAGLKPPFLRLPGGNYLEGDTFGQRFDWKATIGDPSERPGHRSPWNYWSTDGLGLLEMLEWCEELKMEPLLAVFAGFALNGEHVSSDDELAPYIQDALDEIEYVTGDVTTKWGAQRARDGHPKPFPLRYVEIGNEDVSDRARTYDMRFTAFYRAIKTKHPHLQLISTMGVDATPSQMPDVVDEHLYPGSEGEMEARAHDFDTRSRKGPKIFVGEWATRVGSPTTNMAAALADAAYMTGMERNSDLVVLSAYAPLQVNVSNLEKSKDGSMQWESDLIGYDALRSYGSPSYYAQKMFSEQRGDVVLKTTAQDIPTWAWQREPEHKNGVLQPAEAARQLPTLYWVATRKTSSGHVLLKIVNRSARPQPIHFVLSGVRSVASSGTFTVLASDSPGATNTIDYPLRVTPKSLKVHGLSGAFNPTLPAFSVSVFNIATH